MTHEKEGPPHANETAPEESAPAEVSTTVAPGDQGRTRRPRLSQRNGYFPIYKSDHALIRERMGATETGATALATLCGLHHLANDKGPKVSSIEANIALIAHVAGVSYRTALARIGDLEKLGLLSIVRVIPKGRKQPSAASTYTLCTHETVCNSRTRGYASDEPRHSPTSSKKKERSNPSIASHLSSEKNTNEPAHGANAEASPLRAVGGGGEVGPVGSAGLSDSELARRAAMED